MSGDIETKSVQCHGRRGVNTVLLVGVLVALAAPSLGLLAQESTPAWIRRSDGYSAAVVELNQKVRPEAATANAALDAQITDVSAGAQQRTKKAFQQLLQELRAQRAREKDPNVRQDLEILNDHVENKIRAIELENRYELPYLDPAGEVFAGTSALLSDQIPSARRRTALVRLRKYAGLEPGTSPLTTLVEQRLRRALTKRGLSAPSRSQVETNLTQATLFLDEVRGLFQKYDIAGYEPALAELKQQIAEYGEFIREEVLPRCPREPRLPPELYQFRMRQSYGVDASPLELARAARGAFRNTQSEMESLAAEIIVDRGLPTGDYRSVIRALKKDQLPREVIVDEYFRRLQDIEQIVVRAKLLTLPPGKPRIRVATAAESTYYGAPVTICPPARRRAEDQQQCETVLPLALSGSTTTEVAAVDDYTFAAASWTLAAHEIRPGHELQYDAMIAGGVSTARTSLGVKLANPEGWALYAEHLIRPYMPPAARLISLQFLLIREARAFLDPELQAGKITIADAYNLLKNDVVLSDAFADSEVQRLTDSPGSGPSYFFGYSEFLRLRRDVERALGSRFDQQEFHDFILAQGKIPIPIIRRAVFERFVKATINRIPDHSN
jgi:hypothetical protein